MHNIKVYIKIAPTCFGAVTPSSGSVMFELAKVNQLKYVGVVNLVVWLLILLGPESIGIAKRPLRYG